MGLNMNFALVNTQTNVIENVIVLEEGSDWTPPSGFITVPFTPPFSLGDMWDGVQFIKSLPPTPESISEGVQDVIG